ncbi:hypothetical protein KPH14_008009 [Odynerus spinipes]|uniref:Calponin-homology (CH) domain-containing protein n=1 Tax=Odynerus spinipes TaxID=1348599 RepID=A0AAD9VPD4_9HYME|nr:hypothetical protein KPH14_008009 [Odynerus spinipes]
MFFQINVTPKSKKDTKSFEGNTNDLHFTLVLGPFQPQTKITLEAFVNTTVQCYLNVKNISDKDLNVTVTKKPSEDRHIELEISHMTIQSNSNLIIPVKWSPKEIGCWRDVIQFTDNRRIKYDVAVITTAKNPFMKCNKQKKSMPLLLQPSKQITNTNTQPYDGKQILRNKSIHQDNFLSLDKHIKKEKSYSTQDKENIVNVGMSYKHTIESFEGKHDSAFSKKNSDEFLQFMDSSAFNLTVQNTDQKLINKKREYINKMQNIPSDILEEIEVRRETYVKETTCSQNVTIGMAKKEIYEDSLSPQNKNISSEFSILINNLALESTNVLGSSSNQYKTSIKNTSIDDNYIESVETMSVQTDGNGTYNLSPMLSINGTSNLNINNVFNGSPDLLIKTKDLELYQPNHLSPNIDSSSPIRSLKNEWANTPCTGVLPSSSPIPFTPNSNIVHYSTKHADPATVKDVLEADLWVKDNDLCKKKSQACRNITFGFTSMERSLSKCENSTLNKTQTFNKEKSSGVCIEISPPKKSFYSKMLLRKISPKKCGKLVKERYTFDGTAKNKIHANVSTKKNTNLSIPQVRITKLSLTNVIKTKNLNTTSDQSKEDNSKFQNIDNLFSKFCNPDPFSACVTEDPFLSSTMYYDEKWVQNQEIVFKKWLNALLSPPEDLNTDVETNCVDIGKVWQSCKLMENSILAETKEALSARYHTDLRLNTLRKAACAMYRQKEIVHVLSRTTVCIEKGTLTIRLDRDLHRDIGLQKEMLELFLSYNPLWLRIGLETIYGENIPLHSNNDLVGLTRFILTRFFTDPSLKKNYPHAYHRKQQQLAFITQMNKFMLKKFLFLVYFLDYSKINKLIRHDPCLFHKKANIKDSRSILLAFSRAVLSGIGDITKVLRSYEYVVSYKQTSLDEFDYAVKNIQNDLRDGVRLCRVMELINGSSDLTRQCRMPTISRLQKIHNVDIALKALLQCGYALSGNIDAKSIADGHREKTLSLLWQIIYKYQAPRFEKAACRIQNWWRAILWYVRVRNFIRIYKNNAACIIQRAWKTLLARRKLISLREEYMRELRKKEKAVRFLQDRWRHSRRGINDRRKFLHIKLATIKLQRWWRRMHDCRVYIQDFQNTRKASIIIQRQWRAIRAMRAQRITYINMKNACIVIQTYWRGIMLMKSDRMRYIKFRNAVIFIQNRWKFRNLYSELKKQQCVQLKAVYTIEVWWKNILIMRHERNNFLIMKDAANTIKRWWPAVRQQKKFQAMCTAAIIIQKYWRKTVARNEYLKKQVAVMRIETWYKHIILRRNFHNNLLKMKSAVICIQHWWRNISITRKQRNIYLKIHIAVLSLQKWWRSIILSRTIRQQYLSKKRACITIQTWWRMIKSRRQYMYLLHKRNMAAITLQRKWRSTLAMRQDERKYKQLKLYTIKMQKRWRALQNAKQEYYNFCTLKSATICIQRLFRANKISYYTRQWYIRLRQSTIIIQSYWRMRLAHKRYIIKKKAILTIQTHWRAYNKAKKVRFNYELLKYTTIKIQRRYRSNKISRKLAQEYNVLRKTTISLQIRWRAKLLARAQRNELQTYHSAAKIIQKWWWRILFIEKCKFIDFKDRKGMQDLLQPHIRQMYCNVIVSVIKIQRWWKNIYQKRLNHKKQIRAARIIENWWIAILKTKQQTLAATIIQAAWKGFQIRRKQSVHMSEVRQRLIAATKTALPSATLAYRCQKSINILKKCDKIGQLSMCLTSLGVITRLSPKECITLCEHNLIETIYETYFASNRSLPWITVCIQATNILITLAKFLPTKSYICKPRYALPTVKLLHDNLHHKELSLHVATLMWLLTDEEEYKKELKTCSKAIWLLNSIYKKVIKKKDKLTHYSEILGKQTHLYPSCKPDWLLWPKQVRIFTTIEYAVTMIIERLEIEEELA